MYCERPVAIAFVLAMAKPLKGKQEEDYNSYLSFANWKIDVLSNNGAMNSLTENQKSDLKTIADTGMALGNMKARNILNYFYDGNYIHLPEIPDGISEKRASTNNAIEKEVVSYIKVYPNPAKELTTFEYQLPCISHGGILTITEISGKTIYMNNKLTGEHNILNLDTKEWQSGNYFFKLVCDGVNIGEGKLSIIK